MKLYGAIDLHSNNNVTVLIDEKDKVVYQKRLANDLPLILEQLSPYASSIEGDPGGVDLQLVLVGRWIEGERTPDTSGQHGGDPTVRGTEVHR